MSFSDSKGYYCWTNDNVYCGQENLPLCTELDGETCSTSNGTFCVTIDNSTCYNDNGSLCNSTYPFGGCNINFYETLTCLTYD
jgi:hypothetical protein